MTGRRCVFFRGVQERDRRGSGVGPEKASGGGVEGQCFLRGRLAPAHSAKLDFCRTATNRSFNEFSSQSRSVDAAERVRIISATRDEAGRPTVRNARRRTRTRASRVHSPLLTWSTNREAGRASRANPRSVTQCHRIHEAELDSDDEANAPMRPTHGVSHEPNFLARSTHSGLKHDRGGAMLVLDDAAHLPTGFSAGLPGGIQHL